MGSISPFNNGEHMKKIGILSFIHNNNFGSVLQAYALQHQIADLGYLAQHVDYQPSASEKVRNMLTCGNSPTLLLDSLRKRRVLLKEEEARKKQMSLETFLRRELNLSAVCSDYASLQSNSHQHDILLCGSDQIWSPTWLNPAYFLSFCDDLPKIAYACSLGVSTITSSRKAEMMKTWLRGFQKISVREEEGSVLIQQLTGTKPAVVPDPVLLANPIIWTGLATNHTCHTRASGKLVCYFLENPANYQKHIKKLTEQYHIQPLILPIGSASFHMSDMELADSCTPEDFLYLLSEAEMVCTDSFHGALLAALLGRPLYTILRDSTEKADNRNSRIYQLMRLLHANHEEVTVMDGSRQERIREYREYGQAWIKSALDSV